VKLLQVVLLTCSTLFLIGCSSTPSPTSDPVDFAGTVTNADGKPVAGCSITFFPATSSGNQVGYSLKADGKFDIKIIPGKYVFSFDGNPAALAAIPKAYLTNDPAHTVEVPAAGNKAMAIALTK